MDDQQILDLYWQRSEAAIAETDRKYGNYCHNIAFRILGSREDSDECVNDTYLRAWNAIPPHRPENLATFLGKIVRNLAFDRYDHSAAQKRGAGEVPLVLDELRVCLPQSDPAQQLMDGIVLAQVLDRFLAAQPAMPRKIFMLRYWHVCSVREIAGKLGISESRVKMSLFRTRNSLKKILEKEGIGL